MASLVDQEHFQQELYEFGLDPHKENADVDDDGKPRRTGTEWTASAHIITAIIGSGVLSQAWAMAQFGWIAGIGALLIFSFITLYTSSLLADSYRFPDPVTRKRNHTYMEAVEATLEQVVVTVLAMAVPFFNDILALLGAIGYWPMTVYFPVEMYIARKKIQRGSLRWFFLRLLNLACLLVAIAAACGAIEGLNHALKNSMPFKF